MGMKSRLSPVLLGLSVASCSPNACSPDNNADNAQPSVELRMLEPHEIPPVSIEAPPAGTTIPVSDAAADDLDALLAVVERYHPRPAQGDPGPRPLRPHPQLGNRRQVSRNESVKHAPDLTLRQGALLYQGADSSGIHLPRTPGVVHHLHARGIPLWHAHQAVPLPFRDHRQTRR